MTLSDIAKKLFGAKRAETTSKTSDVSTLQGTVVSDSENGHVEVAFDADCTTLDGTNVVSIGTLASLKEGDQAIVMLEGGGVKRPTAIGAAGWGDRIQASIVETNLLIADKADIEDLEAANAHIGNLEADNLTINNRLEVAETSIGSLEADNATINGKLTAAEADIDTLQANSLTADSATIKALEADTAKVHDLSAQQLNATVGYIEDLTSENITATDLTATHAYIADLEADNITASDLSATHAYIADLEADNITAQDLSATHAYIADLEADNVTAQNLIADHAEVGSLDANYAQIDLANIANGTIKTAMIGDAQINSAKIANGSIENADIKNGTIENAKIKDGTIETAKIKDAAITTAKIGDAQITTAKIGNAAVGTANIKNAAITNALIANEAVSSSQILSVSANKLTAGTINAAEIDVTNLHASSLIVDKLNGQPVLGGYAYVNKNISGYSSKNPSQEGWYEMTANGFALSTDTTVDMTKAYYIDGNATLLYDQNYIDGLEDSLNQRIDGAVETFTGDHVPTLNNYPAADWLTDDAKSAHVGDIYFVTNDALNEDGYNYRFAYDNTTQSYLWVLIKDSDVTKALGDISDLQSFESTTTSWINTTDQGLTTIRQNHTALSGRVDSVAATANAALPSSTFTTFQSTTFAELVDEVDEQSSTITSMTERVETVANPNLTPWFSMPLTDVYDATTNPNGYWKRITTHAQIPTYVSNQFHDGSGGWAHIVGNVTSGNPFVRFEPMPISLKPSTKYTFMLEIDGTFASTFTNVIWKLAESSETDAFDLFGSRAEVTSPNSVTSGTYYRTATTNANFSDAITLSRAYVQFYGTGAVDVYVRVSVYEGEYSGPYKPYVPISETVSLTNTVNSVKQTADANTASISSLTSTVNGHTTTLSNHQTSITQNTNNIALKANSSDVYTKTATDGLISTEVTNRNAAITAASNAITASVSETYTTKTEFNNLEIGGRNLVLDSTKFRAGSVQGNTLAQTVENGMYKMVVSNGNTANWNSSWWPNKDSSWSNVENNLVEGDPFVISFTMRAIGSTKAPTIYIKSGMGYYQLIGTLSENWSTVYYAGTWKDANAIAPHLGWVGISTASTYYIKDVKVEKGNKPTDWTPAPEDLEAYADAQVSAAKAEIKITTDGISSEVAKVSSAKYVNSSTASWTLPNIKTYAAEGRSENWNVTSTANLRVGDTVYIKGTDSTRACPIYIKTTVTAINSATNFTGTSHGYEDVLPVETIKSTINQSADSVKIQASHVEIDGTTVFRKDASTTTTFANYVSGVADDAVDGLELGGTNLVPRSHWIAGLIPRDSVCYASNCTLSWYLTDASPSGHVVRATLVNASNNASFYVNGLKDAGIMTNGERYVASVWVRASKAASFPSNAMVEFYNGTYKRVGTANLTTSWQRQSCKFTYSSSSTYGAFYLIYPQKWTGLSAGDYVEIGGIQIEKGDKATDWSPCPDDQNGQYGGTNLFSWPVSGTKWKDEEHALNTYHNTGSFTQFTNSLTFDPLETIGELYTISFDVKSPNGTTDVNLYNSNNTPSAFYFSTVTVAKDVGNEWVHCEHTVENAAHANGNASYNRRIEIYAPHATGVLVRKIKVERGSKATDWTPAPEDVDAAIEAVPGFKYLNSNYTNTLATVQGWCAEGIDAGNWGVSSTAGVRVGDTVYIKTVPSDNNSKPVYCIVTVTSVTSATALRGISHGYLNTAVTDTANAAAPKTAAVSEEQYVYASYVSGTNSASAPSSWVTETGDMQNTWSTKRPTYNSTYPVVFVAKQRKTVSGAVTCTTPIKDDTVTIIDGGHITTGTIDATKVAVTNLDASKITSGYLNSARIQAGSLSIGKLSDLNVGCRNLLLRSDKLNFSTLGSAAGSRKEYYSLNVGKSYMNVEHGTQVTISFDLHMTVATANPTLMVYNTNNKGPKAFSNSATGTGAASGVTLSFTAAAGSVIDERVSVTGYINDRSSPALTDNFLEFYSTYGTNNFYSVSNLKMERGTIATDWTAAPEDELQMVKIDTASRAFTTANWKTYGAVGHSENWNTGSSYDNSRIKVGDTAYLVGTVTDGVGGTATIIGTVTAVNGANGSSSITMTSTQLIFGGDSVDAAAKTATNYITADSTGIKIAKASDTSNYQYQTSSGTDIYVSGKKRTSTNANGLEVFDSDGQTSLAKFGTSARIGKSGKAHLDIDYRSMKMIDKSGTVFFEARDLLDEDGYVVDTFTGNGSRTSFSLSFTATNTTYTVSVNGTAVTSGVSKTATSISFTTAPANNATITARYLTNTTPTKAFTFGSRNTTDRQFGGGSTIDDAYVVSGAGSVVMGVNCVAYNRLTTALGEGTISISEHSVVIGKYNTPKSGLLIVGKGTSKTNRSNALELDGSGNLKIAGAITLGTALTASQIPNLDASKINSGTLGADRIPSLAASKITSGTFDAARIPSLAASIITSGTFGADRIPGLAASKITSGTLGVARGGTNKTSGEFFGATRIYSSTATCTTFTLTASAANYSWLTILYKGNDGFFDSVTVFNNKAAINVALSVIESTANGTVNIKRVTYQISGTSATVKTYGEADLSGSSVTCGSTAHVTVTGVWGWV